MSHIIPTIPKDKRLSFIAQESFVRDKAKKSLVGIVPVYGVHEQSRRLPWHQCLMPIAKDYLAIERSIHECAVIGCDSIWVICPQKITLLLREYIGDWIYDPRTIYKRKLGKYDCVHMRQIAIYYVPIKFIGLNEISSFAYSVLYGAYISNLAANTLSKYFSPYKWYVSNPYAVYPTFSLKDHRALLYGNNNTSFLFTFDDYSAEDGLLLPFTFTMEEYDRMVENATNAMYSDTEYLTKGQTIKRITMKKMLAGVYEQSKHVHYIELDHYFTIVSWRQYCEYLGNQHGVSFHLGKYKIFKEYREFNPIGFDNPTVSVYRGQKKVTFLDFETAEKIRDDVENKKIPIPDVMEKYAIQSTDILERLLQRETFVALTNAEKIRYAKQDRRKKIKIFFQPTKTNRKTGKLQRPYRGSRRKLILERYQKKYPDAKIKMKNRVNRQGKK